MNFLYGQICEAAKKINYNGIKSPTTIVKVNNDDRTILVDVEEVPMELLSPNANLAVGDSSQIILANIHNGKTNYTWITLEEFIKLIYSVDADINIIDRVDVLPELTRQNYEKNKLYATDVGLSYIDRVNSEFELSSDKLPITLSDIANLIAVKESVIYIGNNKDKSIIKYDTINHTFNTIVINEDYKNIVLKFNYINIIDNKLYITIQENIVEKDTIKFLIIDLKTGENEIQSFKIPVNKVCGVVVVDNTLWLLAEETQEDTIVNEFIIYDPTIGITDKQIIYQDIILSDDMQLRFVDRKICIFPKNTDETGVYFAYYISTRMLSEILAPEHTFTKGFTTVVADDLLYVSSNDENNNLLLNKIDVLNNFRVTISKLKYDNGLNRVGLAYIDNTIYIMGGADVDDMWTTDISLCKNLNGPYFTRTLWDSTNSTISDEEIDRMFD